MSTTINEALDARRARCIKPADAAVHASLSRAELEHASPINTFVGNIQEEVSGVRTSLRPHQHTLMATRYAECDEHAVCTASSYAPACLVVQDFQRAVRESVGTTSLLCEILFLYEYQLQATFIEYDVHANAKQPSLLRIYYAVDEHKRYALCLTYMPVNGDAAGTTARLEQLVRNYERLFERVMQEPETAYAARKFVERDDSGDGATTTVRVHAYEALAQPMYAEARATLLGETTLRFTPNGAYFCKCQCPFF